MDIEKLKKLIEQREAIDLEIAAVAGGTVRTRAPQKCSACGGEGHSARTCPTKQPGTS